MTHRSSTGPLQPRATPPPSVRVYTAAELAEATAGFNAVCLIGEGGFGKVYRGMIHLTPVAIKVLDHEGLQGLREFQTELQILGGLDHPHVTRLLGYAAQEASPNTAPCQALVYELMTCGNLEERLQRKGNAAPLDWRVRVRIACETTCALAYLHSKGIIHRDIKPANVFLDSELHAKLGDIGLAVMDTLHNTSSPASTMRRRPSAPSPSSGPQGCVTGGGGGGEGEAIGTWQYLAPEYITQGRSSMRTDAYALGLTLLQLLSGDAKPGALVARAQAALESCTLQSQFLDPSAGEWDSRIAEKVVRLALWCCMHAPEQRPTLATVWSALQKLASICLPDTSTGQPVLTRAAS